MTEFVAEELPVPWKHFRFGEGKKTAVCFHLMYIVAKKKSTDEVKHPIRFVWHLPN